MGRRSRAGGDPVKARRETTLMVKPSLASVHLVGDGLRRAKRRYRPKAVRRRRSSASGRETKEACQAIGQNPRHSQRLRR
jgi:hypothetical protein